MRALRGTSGKLPILIIIIALVVVLAAGGFAFIKMSKKPKGGGKKPKHAEKVELSEWNLGDFIVNLADPGETRYLKMAIVLEVASSGKSKGGGHGEGGNPEEAKAKDTVLSVASKKHYEELLTEKGKSALKDELKTGLNEALEETEVESIYFTSFAMQ